MTFQSYQEYFQAITTQELTIAPYDSEEYREYVKMNEVRQNRWLKKGIIQTECIDVILSISQPQDWILITEPWCGDAAQAVGQVGPKAVRRPACVGWGREKPYSH